MKKICILSTVNIKHMTLLSLYTEYLDTNKIKYDIIYIDKYNKNEKNNADKTYKYDLFIKKEWSFLKKLRKYWRFKKFAINIMNKNNYDFVITWNSFTVFIFADYLIKKYNKKYCINIRDYAHEKVKPISNRLKKAVKYSSFSTISSEGFKEFLPPGEYVNIHSLNMNLLSKLNPKRKLKSKNESIVITYIGNLVFEDNCYKLIDCLGNDDRFIMKFFGQRCEVLEDYAKTKGFNNIITKGRFEPEETADLISDSDIIFNLYDVGNLHVDTALSIKLYYAFYLAVPILVFKNTYMETISKKYGIGFSIDKIDLNKKLGDNLYHWYYSLDQNELNVNSDLFLNKVIEENSKLKLLLNQTIFEQ